MKVSKENILSIINKHFNNINTNNLEYIKLFFDFILDDFLSENQVYLKYKPLFIDYLKNKYKTSKTTLFIEYWTIRGWNIEYAKTLIRKKYKKPVFFTIDEIYDYIILKNPFNFNLLNTEHIKNFVTSIHIDDHIAYHDVEAYFNNWCNSNYYNSYCNKGFLTNNIAYYLARGYTENEAKNIISKLLSNNSVLSKEYYIKKGLTEKDAKLKVSEIQRTRAEKSKRTKKYWLNLGLSDEEAKIKSSYYSEKYSVWSKQYWLNKGYTEEEAIQKYKEYNASCKECKHYNNDIGLYIQHNLNLSKKQKNIWNTITRNKLDFLNHVLKSGWLKNTSKSEIECFDWLKNNISEDILHESYIVLFPENFLSSTNNNYFYVCDGYMVYKDKVIIIEYDGGIGVFHTELNDLNRDKDILLLDNCVLGILRIQETFWKKRNKINIKDYINYAILKIKNCEEERVILS